MGKIYKRKLRSCKMCKPHKMGWAPKETKRQMQEREIAEKEKDFYLDQTMKEDLSYLGEDL